MTNRDVISAFIDNEPFEAHALIEALSDDEGRHLLIDLIALRRLAQPDPRTDPLITRRRPRLLTIVAAAAAVLLALAGGYRWGLTTPRAPEAPPTPTVVIKNTAQWR